MSSSSASLFAAIAQRRPQNELLLLSTPDALAGTDERGWTPLHAAADEVNFVQSHVWMFANVPFVLILVCSLIGSVGGCSIVSHTQEGSRECTGPQWSDTSSQSM